MATGSAQSKPKNPPPVPPPPPDFRCEVVGDAFIIGNMFCQFLRAIGPKDNKSINTETLIRRGKVRDIDASMNAAAAKIFQHSLGNIPKEFRNYRIIFPKDVAGDGRVKLLKYEEGQWYVYWVPAETDWDRGDLLARLVDNQLKLLVDTTAIMRGV